MGVLVPWPGSRRPPQRSAPAPERPQPLPESERLWWRIWAECPGVGWDRIERLQAAFSSLEAAWSAPASEIHAALQPSTHLGPKGLAAVEAYRERFGPSPLGRPPAPAERQRWHRQRCLVHRDASLPEALGKLERPPLQIYWQGRGALWGCLRKHRGVAVVGTRRPSRHGEAMARALGKALAQAGWPVVSGLAEGIDAAVHEGCLAAGGSPVGVLGTPLERVYPRHHAPLQRRVGEAGLLLSEQAPGANVRAGHFAARNRLQVALARAVVLVECPLSSGALHSAAMAWQQRLPLWVVPADAGKVSAAGSNQWLQRGVCVLLDPEDLIRELGPGPLQRQAAACTAAQGCGAPRALINREAALLAALGDGASLEQLSQRLRQSPAQLSQRLLQLELAGVLQGEPGLWWRPC